jgi:hypothetical protein
MTNTGGGTYTANYVVPRNGTVTVSVVLARLGGLYAEYFNNAFLYGNPALARVENIMSYDWKD